MALKYEYIILGGGTTAGYAAKQMVESGIKPGESCIVSAESILPMNRPPLSKHFLTRDEKTADILVNDEDFYKENGITTLLNTEVTAVDFVKKSLKLKSSEYIEYQNLLIATGSKIKELKVKGNELGNVFYLRQKEHATSIKEAARKSEKAVVVGGGFIGTEVAASISKLDMDVTLVLPEEKLLSKFATPEIHNFFKHYLENRGVKVVTGTGVKAFTGNGKVENVLLDNNELIKTDMVVCGVGVEPNTDIFTGNDFVNISGGIEVDEYCRTNIPNVYAAGDVAVFPDKLFGGKRHIEHWDNAYRQGQNAAKNMLGEKSEYNYLPYFFSDVGEVSYEYFGDSSRADKHIVKGNVDKGDFSVLWLKEKILQSAFIMSERPDREREQAKEWIHNKTSLTTYMLQGDAEKIQNRK
jgi:NADPH-dependent 2,4-dienoyl-CoA reductase/sulfur reductase-like enzyme